MYKYYLQENYNNPKKNLKKKKNRGLQGVPKAKRGKEGRGRHRAPSLCETERMGVKFERGQVEGPQVGLWVLHQIILQSIKALFITIAPS